MIWKFEKTIFVEMICCMDCLSTNIYLVRDPHAQISRYSSFKWIKYRKINITSEDMAMQYHDAGVTGPRDVSKYLSLFKYISIIDLFPNFLPTQKNSISKKRRGKFSKVFVYKFLFLGTSPFLKKGMVSPFKWHSKCHRYI